MTPLTLLPLLRTPQYVLPAYGSDYTYYGISSVVQNTGIMLSSVGLWGAQMAGESEYE